MGAHHDLELTPPPDLRPRLLTEADQCDFDHSYGGRIEKTYANHLPFTVYVADRTGSVAAARPQPGTGVFGIRISRTYGRCTTVQYENSAFVTRIGKARPSDLDFAMRDNHTHRERGMGRVEKTKDLRVGFTEDDFRKNGGVIYHAESDWVFSMTIEGAKHAGSPMEVLKRLSDKNRDARPLHTNAAHFSIKIVDNRGRARDRFIHLAGEVHRIKAVREHSSKDGIYVFRDGVVSDAMVSFDDKVDFFEADDEGIERLGLFKSYEEALHWAEDLKVSSERELVKKKGDLAIQKVELESESLGRKDQFEDKSLTRKDQFEDKGLSRKDYYDYSSSRRKDTSDEVKWILGITVTLLGALTLFRK